MATAAVAEQINVAQGLANGRELQYPGDEWLPTPIVYYNPHHQAKFFKVYEDVMPVDADPRFWRPRRFRPEFFVRGRYVAYTRLQNDAVRRVLGQQADRWMGDDLPKEIVCHHRTCGFATRNGNAYDDHQQFVNRHEPQPDLSRFY
jgi:hypothetical protein